MSTALKGDISGVKSDKGSKRLLAKLEDLCDVFADDIQKVIDGKAGAENENLKLLGNKESEKMVQLLMMMIDKAGKIKDLGKESKPDTEDETKQDASLVNIQDFALLKKAVK